MSALVGIATDGGYIGSVDDPIIVYLPELKGKGFDSITIRHLLLMSSGIRYVTDDEASPLAALSQFTDDGLTYSFPNLRSLALSVRQSVFRHEAPAGVQVGAALGVVPMRDDRQRESIRAKQIRSGTPM